MGMAVARRQAMMVHYLKEHEARQLRSHDPQREVFYHHVIERGTPIPFQKYSDYLRQMATTYQNLKFNVIFFTDDSIQSAMKWSRHSKFMNKLLPSSVLYRKDKSIKREICNFLRKYNNVNITITSLVKYMSTTPLRYKLNHVSLPYIIFYARVYTIWQYGGVALDLPNSNEKFMNEKQLHDVATTTFRNFNDGLKQSLEVPSRNKENEFDIFFSCWDFVMNEAWNETRNFFNNSLSWPPMLLSADDKHSRVHRNKREISEVNDIQVHNTSISTSLPINDTNQVSGNFNNSEKSTESIPVSDMWLVNTNTTGTSFHPNKTTIQEYNISSYETTSIKNDSTKYIEMPHIKFFYDVLLISDAMSPAYGGFDTQPYNINLEPDKNSEGFPKQLLIDSKGRFIAAYSHFHPFLSHLMSMAYRHDSPRNCIEEGILTHCSDFYHRDSYCSTIELF